MATLLAVLIGGLLVGVGIGMWWAQRRGTSGARVAVEAEPHRPVDRVPQQLVAGLDALPLGVVVVDGTGSEVVRNRVARSTVVLHHRVLLDEALDELFTAARNTGDDASRVVELQGATPRTVSLAVHPLTGGGAIATLADITERARLDAVRTDFVANLSHELKTPVGALAVLAETLLDLVGGEHLDADDRTTALRLAGKMVAESHRLSRAIDELLELSRIELEGADARTTQRVDTVVCDAVARVRSLAEPVDITVTVNVPAEPLVVHADARQLTSALGNLLENAVKYSDPSSTVEIGAREVDDAVEFWVRDWGVGIPARDLDRIFERFYRVDRARSRDTGGTGLGLSIVRHVAANHGGSVSVTSHEGEGSTFVLRIPTEPADDTRRPEEAR